MEHSGFKKVIAEATGRHAPRDLLMLYVYGYLNRVRSSRMIERETTRKIEVMCRVNDVSPTYKTIADFGRDHVQAIVGRVQELFASADAAQHLAGAPRDEGVLLRNPLTLLALPHV